MPPKSFHILIIYVGDDDIFGRAFLFLFLFSAATFLKKDESSYPILTFSLVLLGSPNPKRTTAEGYSSLRKLVGNKLR